MRRRVVSGARPANIQPLCRGNAPASARVLLPNAHLALAELKQRLGDQARWRTHRLLRRLGFDLVRYTPANFANLRRIDLLNRGGVTLVVDGGANVGEYARALRRRLSRQVSPDRAARRSFLPNRATSAAADERWLCRRVALGETEGNVEINVAGNLWSSSLLLMNSRLATAAPETAYVGKEQVEMITLDALLGPLISDEDRIFLKLDLQGSELPALRGARERLQRVVGVEVELSYVPLYEGQALLPEVVTFLGNAGLDLIALDEAFADRRSGELLQVDGLFTRAR